MAHTVCNIRISKRQHQHISHPVDLIHSLGGVVLLSIAPSTGLFFSSTGALCVHQGYFLVCSVSMSSSSVWTAHPSTARLWDASAFSSLTTSSLASFITLLIRWREKLLPEIAYPWRPKIPRLRTRGNPQADFDYEPVNSLQTIINRDMKKRKGPTILYVGMKLIPIMSVIVVRPANPGPVPLLLCSFLLLKVNTAHLAR